MPTLKPTKPAILRVADRPTLLSRGISVFAEYLWQDQTQNGTNLLTGTVGTGAAGVANGSIFNNNIKSQGFLIGNVVNF